MRIGYSNAVGSCELELGGDWRGKLKGKLLGSWADCIGSEK